MRRYGGGGLPILSLQKTGRDGLMNGQCRELTSASELLHCQPDQRRQVDRPRDHLVQAGIAPRYRQQVFRQVLQWIPACGRKRGARRGDLWLDARVLEVAAYANRHVQGKEARRGRLGLNGQIEVLTKEVH